MYKWLNISMAVCLCLCGCNVGDKLEQDQVETPVVLASQTFNLQSHTDGALFRENFEYRGVGSSWAHNLTRIARLLTGSLDGRTLRVSYVPRPEGGTERMTARFNLVGSVSEATLSFDFLLHEDFEFVRGGKMNGLAGGNATTGCKPVDPEGWSARMTWGTNGIPQIYVYHQDRRGACGDGVSAEDYILERNRWYRAEIYVRLNSGIGTNDGIAALFLDGEKVAEMTGLNLTGSMNTKIDKFIFNTFHHGSDDSYTPSKTVHVSFDNFTVFSGRRITGMLGTTCEIFREGVYNAGSKACCADSCNACGGNGCYRNNGGASNCCVTKVVANGESCLLTGSSAPCSFCAIKGQSCRSFSCCAGLVCNNGTCQDPPPPSCRKNGQSCNSSSRCCSGLTCVFGRCSSCSGVGDSCNRDSDCCYFEAKCVNNRCFFL